MTFFYDLNKRLAQLAEKQDAQQVSENAKAVAPKSKLAESIDVAEADYSAKKARAGRDIGKPGKNFAKIAKDAGQRYGSKAAGERVAGAVLNKLRHPKEGMGDNYDDDYRGYAGEEPDAEIVTTPQGNKFEWHYAGGETDATFVYPGGKITVAYDNTARAFDTDNMQTDDKVARYVFSSYGKNLPKDEVEIGKLIDKIISMKKQGMAKESMDEAAVRIMAKPEGSQVTRGTAAYVPKNSIAGKTPQGQAHRDATAAMAKSARAAGGKLAMNKTTDVTGKRVPGGYDALAKGVTPYRSNTEEGNAFSKAVVDAKRDGIQKGEKIRVGGKELPLKELDMRLLKGAQGAMKGSNTDSESERNRHKKYGYRSDRDDTGNDDDYDEHGNLKNKKKAAASDGPKKKGRPRKEKQPERVTAKSYKYKSGRPTKTKEDVDTDGVMMTRPSNMSSESISPADSGEYNDEAGMTKDSLHTIVRHARELEKCLRQNENLPEWVQEKVGQIKGMMSSVTDYIISTHERDAEQHLGREGITIEPVAEKAVSQAQRKFMGMAHAMQKGEKIKGASPALKKVAKTMKPSDTHDFAATKEKGLPKKVKKTDEGNDGNLANNAKPYDKVTQGDVVAGRLGKDEMGGKAKKPKEKKVDETTVAGSVATAAPSGKSSKGMQFGKGVYESYNQQFTKALNESISIESKMQECGDGEMAPAITVQADGEEAAKLMMLLKLAGLESQIPKACPTCGGSPCGCAEMVDENSPDWPTNTDTLAADPNLRTYSGGLNGPKSTGQSTTPVLASQLRRQASMEESVELERTLFKTWKNYKG
jgi:hypothetical protein